MTDHARDWITYDDGTDPDDPYAARFPGYIAIMLGCVMNERAAAAAAGNPHPPTLTAWLRIQPDHPLQRLYIETGEDRLHRCGHLAEKGDLGWSGEDGSVPGESELWDELDTQLGALGFVLAGESVTTPPWAPWEGDDSYDVRQDYRLKDEAAGA